MKKLFTLLTILFISLISLSQDIKYSFTRETIKSNVYIIFTFENLSNEYLDKDVTINYITSNGKYSFRRVKKFDIFLKPNEIKKSNLSYLDGNNMIIKADGEYLVRDIKVIFE